MIQQLEEILHYENPSVIERFQNRYPFAKSDSHLIFDDLKRFLWLSASIEEKKQDGQDTPDISFSESMYVLEEMWQAFILSTNDYIDFCNNYFGRYLHHPTQKIKYQANFEKLGKDEAMEIFVTDLITCVYENLGEEVANRWFDQYTNYEKMEHSSTGDSASTSIKNYTREEFIREKKRMDFKSQDDIPKYTQDGFILKKIPETLFNQLLEFYNPRKGEAIDEYEKGSYFEKFIQTDTSAIASGKIDIDNDIKQAVNHHIQPIVEDWLGKELLSTATYGIRVYRRGAYLNLHTDRFQTHIIGVILNIDQKVEEPWHLQIKDHENKLHELILDTGEMLLYESATLEHGRVNPLKGDYYSNLFAHYIPID